MHAAYRPVPGVELTGRLGSLRVRFTLLLRRGVATAEAFRGTSGETVTVLVARGDGPTYAREPGSSCWRRLRRSNPQSLHDIGLRFPDVAGMRVKAPRRAGDVWLLPFTTQGHSATLRISAKTHLVESVTTTRNGQTVTEHDRALTKRPKLPAPTPTC